MNFSTFALTLKRKEAFGKLVLPATLHSVKDLEEYEALLSERSTEESESNDLDRSARTRKEESYENYNTEDLKVRCQLGEGAEGTVYLVEDEKKEKKFALKVLPKRQVKGPKEKRSKAETKLDHPFITKLYTTFLMDNYKALLLEFWQGGDLFYHMERVAKLGKSFSEDTVKFYISGLILALDYLHKENYIFRDLKPENVLIDSDGYPKLCDFGLSISRADINFKTCRKRVGTREYFSPEITKSQIYDVEADWWTLGILTYELLFGYPPFQDDNIFSLQNKIRTQEPWFTTREDLSEDWISFISGLLAKDKNERLGWEGLDSFVNHPWLSDIDWKALEAREIASPYWIREISTCDTYFFKEQYTNKEIKFRF